MKQLKYISIAALVFAISVVAQALDSEQVVQRRTQAAQLPKSDSAILYHGTVITIHDDGRVDREEHIFRYLRNLNAWDEYGDPHITFNSKRQTLEVQTAVTHTTDGRHITSTPNAFNPIVPFGLDKAPDFTDYRQMVVTLLGIEHDAVTELKYVVSDTEPLYPWAWGEILFGSREPTLERVITIRAPRNAGLTVTTENGVPDGDRSVSGDMETVTFRMTDLPSIDMAEASAYASRFLPRISYSTCPDWKTFTGEVENRFRAAMEQTGDLPAALAAYRSIADDRMRLDSTVTFLQNRLAVKRFPDQGMLLQYRPVDRIYSTGYAGPADMAVITAAALKEVGFDPKVYLLAPELPAEPGVSGHETYSLHVEMEPLSCRVDPLSGTVDYLPPEDSAYLGVFPAGEPDRLMPTPYSESKADLQLDLTFAEDGSATGWILAKTSGRLSQFNTAVEKGADGVIGNFTSALYASPEIENAVILYQDRSRVEARADLTFDPLAETVEGLFPFVIPWKTADFDGFLPDRIEFYQPRRDVPVFMDCTGEINVIVTVRYPDGWAVETLPVEWRQQVDGVQLERAVETADGSVTFRQKLVVLKNRFPAEQWNSWRKLFMKADKDNLRTVLFQTGL
jgi:hypothetical protein